METAGNLDNDSWNPPHKMRTQRPTEQGPEKAEKTKAQQKCFFTAFI